MEGIQLPLGHDDHALPYTYRCKITDERRKRLEALGFVFDREDPWEVRYAIVRKYYEEHKTLVIPASVTIDGVNLSKWVSDQRVIYHGNRKGKSLTEDQIARLEAMGMVWDKAVDAWNNVYDKLKALYLQQGNLTIPRDHEDVRRLIAWMAKQKNNRDALSAEQIRKLDDIGFEWLKPKERAWENNYAEAVQFHTAHGSLDVGVGTVTESGFRLGLWISKLRSAKNSRNADH